MKSRTDTSHDIERMLQEKFGRTVRSGQQGRAPRETDAACAGSEPQPFFLISDLHLGAGGNRDNFEDRKRGPELDSFLEMVRTRNGQLIILGDLFEFWQFSMGEVLRYRQPLLKKLDAMGAVYVIGNHDYDLWDLHVAHAMQGPSTFTKRIAEWLSITAHGKKYLLMHGHEADDYNNDTRPNTGRLLTILAGIIEDQFKSSRHPDGAPIESDLSSRATWVKDKIFVFAVLGCLGMLCCAGAFFVSVYAAMQAKTAALFWLVGIETAAALLLCYPMISALRKIGRYVFPLMRGMSPGTPGQDVSQQQRVIEKFEQQKIQKDCDYVIVGHTHRPMEVGGWYFNSGSWVEDVPTYVEIIPGDAPRVMKWVDGQGVPL